jgi:hypothetical protein
VAPPRSCGIFLHYLTEKLKRSPCGPAFRVAEVLAVVVPSLERVILHGNQVIAASAEYSPPLVGNYVPLMAESSLGIAWQGNHIRAEAPDDFGVKWLSVYVAANGKGIVFQRRRTRKRWSSRTN